MVETPTSTTAAPVLAVSRVDLHTHTTASDGTHTPAELVALAATRGIEWLAVTDHDSTDGVPAALAAMRERTERGLAAPEVVAGVELNTDVPYGEVHVLGYLLDYTHPMLQQRLLVLREGRQDRGRLMVEKLQALGLDVSWDRVRQLARGAVGRPHVALALVEAGYVSTVSEAFERYLGRGGPAYVERMKVTPADAVALVRQVGGVPVLAHPADIPDLGQRIADLVAVGLQGLEVHYGRYTQETIAGLLEVAGKHDLIVTGGSDFHGASVIADAELGGTYVPPQVIEALYERKRQLG